MHKETGYYSMLIPWNIKCEVRFSKAVTIPLKHDCSFKKFLEIPNYAIKKHSQNMLYLAVILWDPSMRSSPSCNFMHAPN